VFIEPKGEAQSAPTTASIDQDLTAFAFGFVRDGKVATAPDGVVGGGLLKIGPEDCAIALERERVEQELGVAEGSVVCVEQEHFPEGGVD
jgi:hypothetical protein